MKPPAPPPAAPTSAPSARPTAEPGDAEPFEGTAGVVEVTKPHLTRPVLLRDVRVGKHAGFDRVVFEFAGDQVPAYHIAYIDKPVRQCATGTVVPVAGQGWLEVRFGLVNAHDERGKPTMSTHELTPKLPALLELEQTCDFEALVTWVLGVGSPNRYRAVELSGPPRLVVDIKH